MTRPAIARIPTTTTAAIIPGCTPVVASGGRGEDTVDGEDAVDKTDLYQRFLFGPRNVMPMILLHPLLQ